MEMEITPDSFFVLSLPSHLVVSAHPFNPTHLLQLGYLSKEVCTRYRISFITPD